MDSYTIYCPFCGRNITGRSKKNLNQEETASRDFSFENHWHGRYIRETKTKIKFRVWCCEECHREQKNFDRWSDKYAGRVYPIVVIVAIIGALYQCYIENNWSFSLVVFRPILYSIILIFITGIPVIIGHILHNKRISYKRAQKCNALFM